MYCEFYPFILLDQETEGAAHIHGDVYEIDDAKLAELDYFEGGYDRKEIEVTLKESGKTIKAWVYLQRAFKAPNEWMYHETTGDYMNYI